MKAKLHKVAAHKLHPSTRPARFARIDALSIVKDTMPKAPKGCTIVASDDFLGDSLDLTKWWTWSGEPGGDPSAWWDAEHVSVKNSLLRLETSYDSERRLWVSGGVGSQFSQIGGRYLFRARVAAARAVSSIALLWPAGGVPWPVGTENDLLETDPGKGGSCDSMAVTLHYGKSNSTIQQGVKGIDFTKWHNYDATWTPGKSLTVSIDNAVVSNIQSADVGSSPMRLDFQAQFLGGKPPAGPSYFEIDWIVQLAQS